MQQMADAEEQSLAFLSPMATFRLLSHDDKRGSRDESMFRCHLEDLKGRWVDMQHRLTDSTNVVVFPLNLVYNAYQGEHDQQVGHWALVMADRRDHSIVYMDPYQVFIYVWVCMDG